MFEPLFNPLLGKKLKLRVSPRTRFALKLQSIFIATIQIYSYAPAWNAKHGEFELFQARGQDALEERPEQRRGRCEPARSMTDRRMDSGWGDGVAPRRGGAGGRGTRPAARRLPAAAPVAASDAAALVGHGAPAPGSSHGETFI